MVWSQLPYRSPRHAQHLRAQAQLRGFGLEACAGRRRYSLRVLPAAPATWTPMRLRVHSSLGVGHLELDLDALDPALSPVLAECLPADRFAALLCAHSAALCMLEGVLGTTLRIDSGPLRRRPVSSALMLEVTDRDSGRTGRIGLRGRGWLQALQRRAEYQAWQSQQRHALRAHLQVPVSICLPASRLARGQLARVRPGAVVRVASERPLLRLRLVHGHADFPLTLQETRCMIQSPSSLPLPADGPLVAVDQIMLDLDVVLATLRLSVEDIARLRPGTTLEVSETLTRTDVTLRCEGTPFAHGALVRLGEHLGVVIERISSPRAP